MLLYLGFFGDSLFRFYLILSIETNFYIGNCTMCVFNFACCIVLPGVIHKIWIFVDDYLSVCVINYNVFFFALIWFAQLLYCTTHALEWNQFSQSCTFIDTPEKVIWQMNVLINMHLGI